MNNRPTSVLMVLTSHDRLGDTGRPTGWFLSEAAHPWKVLRDAGFAVSFASPLGGRPAMYGQDLEDPTQREFLARFGADGPDTAALVDVDPTEFDAVFFVGGHGTMWDFAEDKMVVALAGSIYDDGGVVAAICHGSAALLNVQMANGAPLVEGRRLAAFTNSEEEAAGLTEIVPFALETELVARGAIHQVAADFVANVVVDGRLVTGQNPASGTGVGEAIVEVLNSISS